MLADRWEDASAYERFMGRWSRALARELVPRLGVPEGGAWLEIGCGTGSLTTAICELGTPARLVACDVASDYVAYCRENLRFPALEVVPISPGRLPEHEGGFDAVVSSLVLNFLPSPVDSLAAMRDASRPGGLVAAAVWDYAEGMEFLRIFWDAVSELDPASAPLDEGRRFPICRREPLREAFAAAGLGEVAVEPIEVPTPFASFDDFWAPLVHGPGPAPTYVSTLDDAARIRLEERLRAALSRRAPAGLRARAWAARGVRPSR